MILHDSNIYILEMVSSKLPLCEVIHDRLCLQNTLLPDRHLHHT